jgi:hypothetical protein
MSTRFGLSIFEHSLLGFVRFHNVKPLDDLCSTLSQILAMYGDEDMVEPLLELEVDLGVCGGHSGSAVHGEPYHSNLGTLEKLLSKDADVHTVGGSFGTVFQTAVCSSSTCKAVIQTPLDVKANISLTGSAQ